MAVDRSRSSLFAGAFWMVAVTLLLFFLPAINGLIGGLVGGYKVGTAGRGFLASLIPAAIVALGLWLILIAFDLPVVGVVAGLAAGVLILLSEIGLLLGAAIGGALRQVQRPAAA